jgi:hypothetical protein
LFFSTIISALSEFSSEFTSSSPIPIAATGFVSVFYLLIAVICYTLSVPLSLFSSS